MGDEIEIRKIECYRDCYQVDFFNVTENKGYRAFIRKDALLALLTVAEKQSIENLWEDDNAS